ncbi:hypothetical protein [Chryseobacterium sp. JK1]|uniref:hypothetical protein n=1 Tax=Chryseobacterium sp. JK1 TaxID=874294 RepID=UPI003D691B7B
MNLKEKKKVELLVKDQLTRFINTKGLTKKNNRLVNPIGYLKKIKLAKEFGLKCSYTIQKNHSKEYKIYFENEVFKACNVIIAHYL